MPQVSEELLNQRENLLGQHEGRKARLLERFRQANTALVDLRMYRDLDYDEPREYEVREGIAIVDISGPLMADSWWCLTYGDICRAVRAATLDSSVSGILLRINSPGGQTDRAFESAAVIEEAGKKKPIWSVADVNAYSAGYLLACCGERIYAAPVSGGLGSIGVYSAHIDYSELLQKEGIKITMIGRPEGKTAGNPYEPLSDEAKAEMISEVERLSSEFYSFVSRRRKMSVEDVKALNAGLKHGSANAIAAKLADRSGSLDEALADMKAMISTKTSFPVAAAAATDQTKEVHKMDQPTVAAEKTADQAVAAAAAVPATATAGNDSATANNAGASPEAKVTPIQQPTGASLDVVIAMCAVAGHDAKTAQELFGKGLSVADLQRELQSRRAKADEIHQTNSSAGAPVKAAYGSAIGQAVAQIQANDPTLNKHQATARALRMNPALYSQYLAENPAQTTGKE